MNDKNDESSFRVVDRRRFTDEGESRPNVESTPPQGPAHSEPTQLPRADHATATAGPMPALEFSHFVLSLATSAQIAMGLVVHPDAPAQQRDLAAARQTIDIIAMLQEKTKGNLSKDESQLIEEIVYTLRVQYVQVSQAPRT